MARRAWRLLCGVAGMGAALSSAGCESDPVAACGNGIVDPGEACDNGAANSDTQRDACRTSCTLPRCGDGIVDSGELCDTTSPDPERTCNAACDALGCKVGSTHGSLDEALGDATCDVVILPSGTYVGNLIIDRDMTLEGDAPLDATGQPGVVLDGGGAASVVTILPSLDVVISKISIINGLADAGGGIHTSGNLTLQDSVIQGNGARYAGAGVYSLDGTVTVDRSVIALNTITATDAGASIGGGGILAEGGLIQVQGGSVIESNQVSLTLAGSGTAASAGGGIAAIGADIQIRDGSAVVGNSVEAIGQDGGEARGGGIYVEGGALTINAGGSVSDNAARGGSQLGSGLGLGGGLYVVGGDVTLFTVDLAGNTAEAITYSTDPAAEGVALGGGIYLDGGTLLVDEGSSLHLNEATSTGELEAVSEGGALHAEQGDVMLAGRSSVYDNTAQSMTQQGLASGFGGGVFVRSATLGLDDVYVENNAVRAELQDGLAAAVGGGLHGVDADISIVASKIYGNLTEGLSHGTAAVSALGGGLSCGAELGTETCFATLADSAVQGNIARAIADGTGAATASGGGIVSRALADQVQSKIVVERCSIQENSAIADDAIGGRAGGGALWNVAGLGTAISIVEITNSTVSANLASGDQGGVPGMGDAQGGGILSEAQDGSAEARLLLSSATIANNIAAGATASGGGLSLAGGLASSLASTLSKNSLIAANTATDGPDCSTVSATLTSGGYNLIEDATLCVMDGNPTGDLISVAPMLGPLADNGGPTDTHALLAGSPAIDAGNPAGCTDASGATLPTDQRGEQRSVGPSCDIGAYESP